MNSITRWNIVWHTGNPPTGEQMINKFTAEQRDKLRQLKVRQQDYVRRENKGMYTNEMRDTTDGLHDIEYLRNWIDGKCDSNFREHLAMKMANKLHVFLRNRGY